MVLTRFVISFKRIIALSLLQSLSLLLFSQNDLKIITTNYPPFQYQENGKLRGVSYEIVIALLDRSGLDIPIFIYPWERAKHEIETEPNTLFFNLSRTAAREDLFEWIADITPTNIHLWKLKSNNDIIMTSFEDIKNYSIGVLENTVSHSYLQNLDIPDSNFTKSVYTEDLVRMLIFSRVDVIPLDEIAFKYIISQLGYNMDQFEKVFHLEEISSKSYLVANKETDQDILYILNKSWLLIEEDGTYQRILDKYIYK